MACGIPTLLIGARSGAVRLALTPEERPVWPEDLASGAPALEVDDRPDFLIEGAVVEGLSGFEGTGQVLVNLYVGDEFVAADVFRTDAGWVIRPEAAERPFADVVGIARISILFATPGGGRTRLHAEPIQVRLPPGPAADNLLAMSRLVAEEGSELFGSDELLFTDVDEEGGSSGACGSSKGPRPSMSGSTPTSARTPAADSWWHRRAAASRRCAS